MGIFIGDNFLGSNFHWASFLMTYIPFYGSEIFSLMCLLKSNFWSRFKPICFWETLRPSGVLLKKNLGWKGCAVFWEKIWRLFGNIGVEHHFPLICPFWDSFQVTTDFLDWNIVIYNWKNRCIISRRFYVSSC